jgi:hypothetical protein
MTGANSMVEEEWRDIPEFPNYQVSSQWRVKNKERQTIKATIQDGALTVKLSKDGHVYHRGVRGIFLAAFPEKEE